MKKTPPVDRRGSSLTPGERFKNWCGGVVQIWPLIIPLLGGAVWGNSETVRNFVKGEQLEPVDGIHQPDDGNFETQVRKSISDIVAKLKRIDADSNRRYTTLKTLLQAEEEQNFESLESRLERQEQEIQAIRSLVQ